MRNALTIAGAALILFQPANAQDTAAQSELSALEAKLQMVVSTLSNQTTIHDVNAALGTRKEGWVQEPCRIGYCLHTFGGNGGTLVPFGFRLELASRTWLVEGDGPMDWRGKPPWGTDEGSFAFMLDDDGAAKNLCLSLDSWDKALSNSGWSKLQPFRLSHKVEVGESWELPLGDKPELDFPISGYVTKRGNTYLALSSAGSDREYAMLSAKDLRTFLAFDNHCMRVVTVGERMDRAAYEIANGLPSSDGD